MCSRSSTPRSRPPWRAARRTAVNAQTKSCGWLPCAVPDFLKVARASPASCWLAQPARRLPERRVTNLRRAHGTNTAPQQGRVLGEVSGLLGRCRDPKAPAPICRGQHWLPLMARTSIWQLRAAVVVRRTSEAWLPSLPPTAPTSSRSVRSFHVHADLARTPSRLVE